MSSGGHHHFYSASPSAHTPTSRSFAMSPTDDDSDEEGNAKVDFYFPGAASLSDQLDSKYHNLLLIALVNIRHNFAVLLNYIMQTIFGT